MKILIYADGGETIGMGHIMRMMCLAKSLQKHSVQFVCKNDKHLKVGRDVLTQNGFDVTLVSNLDDVLFLKADILIVDSYDVSALFFIKAKEKFSKTICIDDECELEFYDVDLILNQNIYANELIYNAHKRTKKIFNFMFLRDEFLNLKKIKIKKDIKDIVFTLGGSDDNNLSKKIILDIKNFITTNAITLHVIIGKAFKFKSEILSLQDRYIRCYENANMSQLMSKCDVGICGFGQSAYEFLHLGVPVVGLALAKNQERSVKHAYDNGYATTCSINNIAKELCELSYDKRLAIRKNIDEKFNMRIFSKDMIKDIMQN